MPKMALKKIEIKASDILTGLEEKGYDKKSMEKGIEVAITLLMARLDRANQMEIPPEIDEVLIKIAEEKGLGE